MNQYDAEEVAGYIKQLHNNHQDLQNILQNEWHPALTNLIEQNLKLQARVKALEDAYAELLFTGKAQ